jgi:Alpha-(1->3)-arabinofuranosyltransferase
VKEETAQGSIRRILSLDRPVPEVLRKALIPGLFVALALLVTTGYGSGVQLNDGQAALHIDPLKYLWHLLHAWNPLLYYGTHTGFWFPYETPYAWAYGVAQLLGISQSFAQHIVVFAVYLGCLASMYYCLRSVAPWLDEISRLAGSCAYLFNMYVALNSQAQIVWLLTYAVLPALVGVTARAMRGETNIWRGALAIALLVLVGAGINPPLVAINVVVLALFVAITISFDPKPNAAFRRTLPFLAAASVAAVAVNLYWLIPFVDYFRGVWLNGVLTEAPSMHNATTSFANVLRGLGHWATFVSFGDRPYFPWAAAYKEGLFGALLWFVPIVGLSGVAFRRNQRPVTLFFLIVTLVSVPIVVGYYHDGLGNAVTTPIYDAFYRDVPGFQMFRFSYKWVAGVEFGIAGLYALGGFALVAALRDLLARLNDRERDTWAWSVPAVRTALVVLPILIFVPVLVNKMNYPGQVIPKWAYRESALVGNDQGHRVALFPTQFLEQFDWGNPEFYIEDSFVDRPMIYGLLGSEPSEGTDVWVRRAYRATREGLPFASDMFRVLGVDTILQRDDFIPAIDFSSPGEWRFNTTTLTHDLLHRVVKATPVRADGPLHVYHIAGALPLVYGVTHPVVATLPTFTDGYLGDVSAMAKGQARFDPPSRSADEFTSVLSSLSPILPMSAEQIRDLAVNLALVHGVRVHPPSADAAWSTSFDVKDGGLYTVYAMEHSLLFAKTAPQTIEVDGTYLSPKESGGAWTGYGEVALSRGKHWVSDGYLDPDLIVALVRSDDLHSWIDRIASIEHAMPKNAILENQVYAHRTEVTIPSDATYRVAATAVGPFGPDGLIAAHVRREATTRGIFPADLGATLPYTMGDGVIGTSALRMPERWYRDEAGAYEWERGDPLSWFLFTSDAHVRVFVPGTSGSTANVAMRISRLQVASQMNVRVNGALQRKVELPGPAAGPQAYDTFDRLEGPVPVPIRFALTLQPGWNDVSFAFHLKSGEPADLGAGLISAAVAPDLSFTRISATPAQRPSTADRGFSATAFTLPPAGLFGDPEIQGVVNRAGSRGDWLAVALRNGSGTFYRLYPVAKDGSFDVDFMHAMPNAWNDASDRVLGVWLLDRGGRPTVANVSYDLHALPGRALRHPDSLQKLPIKIDGRAVGARPVFLRRGVHSVASGDPEVKIGLLTIAPVTLPKSKRVTLGWTRPSPTVVDVAVPKNAGPFLMVFGEAFHPHWRATLEGEPLTHVIVNGLSNGWAVPNLPDGGKIVLTFDGQQAYLIAAGLSLIALVILIVLACAPDLWPIRASDD